MIQRPDRLRRVAGMLTNQLRRRSVTRTSQHSSEGSTRRPGTALADRCVIHANLPAARPLQTFAITRRAVDCAVAYYSPGIHAWEMGSQVPLCCPARIGLNSAAAMATASVYVGVGRGESAAARG